MAWPVDEWDPEKMLDLYVHDYMMKKKMYNAAAVFSKEACVGPNPAVLDSPDGFLHEWWSFFYDIYFFRQLKHQKLKAKAPVKVEQMTEDEQQNALLHVPQWSVKRQRSGHRPFGTNFHEIMGKKSSCLWTERRFEEEQHISHLAAYSDPDIPILDVNKLNLPISSTFSSSYRQRQICGQPDQLAITGRRMDISSSMVMSVDPVLYGAQNCMLPGFRLGNADVGGLNAEHGWVLNSLTQVLNCQQIPQSMESCPQNMLVQTLSLKSVKQASGNSSNVDVQNMMLTKSIMNASEAQLMVQIKQTEEQHRQLGNLNQHLPENKRKRKKRSNSRAEDKTLDCVDAAMAEKPLDEDVASFLSQDEDIGDKGIPLRNLKRHSADGNKDDYGFTFEEVSCLRPSKSKVLCCHFSSDGQVLASAGHDKKVSIWKMEAFDLIKSSEGHSLLITDVRFRPSSSILATSSFDRTVQIWNSSKLINPLFRLVGHNEQVLSLDFHPRKVDLLCSCDTNDEIRLWNINTNACVSISKGASKQVRFQPESGKLLATASGNNVNLMDSEIGRLQFSLKGHGKDVQSICWDSSAKFIASVSEDSARLWSIVSGGKLLYELHAAGNKFQSCTFHPGYSQLLIIGGYQSLEIWNPSSGDKTWSVPAHNGLISSLAYSTENEMMASASHDQCVKLWK